MISSADIRNSSDPQNGVSFVFDAAKPFKRGKDEFDHLINTLRGLEAPDATQAQHEAILRDRAVLTSYCYRSPDSKRPGFYGRELTLRADTQKHAYILRLNPKKGDYNLYCYCYRKDWFDRHLNNPEKGIRFIDPNYKELFRIEDGDKIRYFTNSGEPRHLICRYIDDYHFEATSDRGKHLRTPLPEITSTGGIEQSFR